jgi:hypothetical protein
MPTRKAKVDDRSLNAGKVIVDKIIAWAKGIGTSLDESHYYLDSLEIDLGLTVPFQAGGKLTIKNRTGQSVPHS